MTKKLKNKKIKIIYFTLSFLLFTFLFFSAAPIFAQEPQGIFSDVPCFRPAGECVSTPNNLSPCECDLCDFLYVLLKVANWGLNGIGALALLFFVFGGLVWLTSAGDKNRVAAGKKILTGTALGIIIILSAYLVINFTISTLTGKPGQFYIKSDQLKEWYNVCEIKPNQ